MKLSLYKMTPVGMVATANMLLVVLAFLLGGPHLHGVGGAILYVTAFPGWLWLAASATSYPDPWPTVIQYAVVFVLNAYLWGAVLGKALPWMVSKIKSRRTEHHLAHLQNGPRGRAPF